ncbi:MAG: divalent-cation tolerance protein CutA [Deltaproteobacteria bacterium]|nr:divalent-cation tolerance protein CutA [Deltaproteobacteria bacterium]
MASKKTTKIKKMVLAYIITKNKREAQSIGSFLLKKRIAGCINIIPSIESCYYWKNRIEKGHESILLVKSLQSKTQEIIKEVKRLHSYSVPCIMFVNISDINVEYFKWLTDSMS